MRFASAQPRRSRAIEGIGEAIAAKYPKGQTTHF